MENTGIFLITSSVILASAFGIGLYIIFQSDTKTHLRPSKQTSTKKISKKIEKEIRNASDTDDSSNQLRGYKKTSDGKTTTYFHREISAADKQLLGDFAPKKIDQSPQKIPEESSFPAITSAWNSAGTWEEKNLTTWATKQLKDMILQIKCPLPEFLHLKGNITIQSISSIAGDAAVTCIRGKMKYIYDFTIVINWKIQLANLPSGSTVTGTVTVSDVTADSDYEFETTVSPTASSAILNKSMSKLVRDDNSVLLLAIRDALDRFFVEMKTAFK